MRPRTVLGAVALIVIGVALVAAATYATFDFDNGLPAVAAAIVGLTFVGLGVVLGIKRMLLGDLAAAVAARDGAAAKKTLAILQSAPFAGKQADPTTNATYGAIVHAIAGDVDAAMKMLDALKPRLRDRDAFMARRAIEARAFEPLADLVSTRRGRLGRVLGAILGALLLGAVACVAFGIRSGSASLRWAAFALFAVAVVMLFVGVQRLRQRWMVASATGDERAAAAAFDDAMSFPVRFEWRRAPVHVRLDAASLLILEERWHDALTVLENITANELPPNQKPVHQNNLAYVLAHVGRSDDATRLAQPLFDELPAEHGVHRFALHTLATAHLVGGRPREAAEVLRELATSPAARAIEAFTYGEALRELGDVDGARAALLRSVDLGLKGRQLARARERLQALGAYR